MYKATVERKRTPEKRKTDLLKILEILNCENRLNSFKPFDVQIRKRMYKAADEQEPNGCRIDAELSANTNKLFGVSSWREPPFFLDHWWPVQPAVTGAASVRSCSTCTFGSLVILLGVELLWVELLGVGMHGVELRNVWTSPSRATLTMNCSNYKLCSVP